MTFQQFIEKHNGKYLEVAGSANATNQCVDLANAYIRDVLGLPIIEWTNAVDFHSKVGDRYDYILNTPTNIPQEGDLIIFKGTVGHISVFIEGNVNSFRSFDQNFPTGSPCHVQGHTYANVLGWLRAKKQVIKPSEPIITDQTKIDLGVSLGVLQVDQIRSKLLDSITKITELESSKARLVETVDDLTAKLADALVEPENTATTASTPAPTYTATYTPEPSSVSFTHPIAQVLYKIALRLG